MKKKWIISGAFIVISIVSLAIGAYAASDIKLFVNGKQASAQVEIIDGNSYVPLRTVAELLGAEVKWDGSNREIHIGAIKDADTSGTSEIKSFNVGVNLSSGPMKLDIAKVSLDPEYKPNSYSKSIKAIIFEVSVENTSSDTVNWHPNQGKLVTNTKEQVDTSLFYSDQVGGEFIGKVVKKGKIVFEVKSSLSDVTSLNYKVTAPFGESFNRVGEDKTTEIILK
ncbi:stalk domain-containing protein [Paenibacillus filicis]|uniref:Stalk domain-containing protein n=1 Tax=Paenibacillus filicis TaxID=669464 RepID=A0ABU9DPC5_9BACL